MSKRSREASFSPSAGLKSSSVSVSDSGPDHSDDLDELELARPLKISAISSQRLPSQEPPVMQCLLPPHRDPVDFPSIEAFELHYAKDHCNRCSSCGKNLPSPRFLTLHIDENHNALREELEAKGEKTYACFVEDCDKTCSTPQKRRLHLIDKHGFPKFYNFRVVDQGIDRSNSMLKESKSHRRRVSTTNSPADAALRRRRTSSLQQAAPGVESANQESSPDVKAAPVSLRESSGVENGEMKELEKSMSALRFVPPSVMRNQGRRPQ